MPTGRSSPAPPLDLPGPGQDPLVAYTYHRSKELPHAHAGSYRTTFLASWGLAAVGRRRWLALCLALGGTWAVFRYEPRASAAAGGLRQWASSAASSQRLRPPAWFQGSRSSSLGSLAPPLFSDLDDLDNPSPPRCPTMPDTPRPLVPELGERADQAFDTVGSLCIANYYEDLEAFIQTALPSRELSLEDPHSALSNIRSYLNATLVALPADDPARRDVALPSIPHRIHQTARSHRDVGRSWTSRHPDWEYHQSDDREADEWVRDVFGEASGFGRPHGKQRLDGQEVTGLVALWRRMKGTMIMRSDTWRYLRLLKDGGVYSDIDTVCLRPFDEWSQWQGHSAGVESKWAGKSENRQQPRVIVGIEADVGTREDWHVWYPRPLSLTQWTIAAAPGHPILLDTIRRLYLALNSHFPDPASDIIVHASSTSTPGVVDLTGPGPFTDAVLRYLGAMTEGQVTWGDLRDLPEEGKRFGDVLVLPITAFSPGVGHMGSKDSSWPGAFVQHKFAGSWKHGGGR